MRRATKGEINAADTLSQLRRMQKVLLRLAEFSDPMLRALFASLADEIKELADRVEIILQRR